MAIIPELLSCHHLEGGLIPLLNQLSPTTLSHDKAIEIIKRLQVSNKTCLVFVDSDNKYKAVATGSVILEEKLIHNGGKVAHVEDVVVDEQYRGRGIGAIVMDRLEYVAKQHQCYKIILNCSQENEEFYSKLGYYKHEEGMRKDL